VRGPKIISDFASGNLRFEQFLTKHLGGVIVPQELRLIAYDNCDLLIPDWHNNHRSQIEFNKVDLLKNLITSPQNTSYTPSDLTVCFGFMHHVPTFHARLNLIQTLIDTAKPNSLIIISFWGFANTAQSKLKYYEMTQRFVADYEKASSHSLKLESVDYLIGWQNKPNTDRYCHNFTNLEIQQIVEKFSNKAEIVDKFQADGKTDKQNFYLILRKKPSTSH
jgi:hypothetical protein